MERTGRGVDGRARQRRGIRRREEGGCSHPQPRIPPRHRPAGLSPPKQRRSGFFLPLLSQFRIFFFPVIYWSTYLVLKNTHKLCTQWPNSENILPVLFFLNLVVRAKIFKFAKLLSPDRKRPYHFPLIVFIPLLYFPFPDITSNSGEVEWLKLRAKQVKKNLSQLYQLGFENQPSNLNWFYSFTGEA